MNHREHIADQTSDQADAIKEVLSESDINIISQGASVAFGVVVGSIVERIVVDRYLFPDDA